MKSPTGNHKLEHIYAKLGIHSRRELMAMGERLEDVMGERRESGVAHRN